MSKKTIAGFIIAGTLIGIGVPLIHTLYKYRSDNPGQILDSVPVKVKNLPKPLKKSFIARGSSPEEIVHMSVAVQF